MEKEVWNKAMEDTTGQRNYFLAHAARYKAGERMVGELYSSQSKEFVEQLKDLADQDSASHSFVAKHRIREESGIFGKEDRPVFSKITWAPGLHLAEHNGLYYLVGIKEILPPGPQTFEEARASVISDYQSFLEESWITELKRKFAVKVEKKAKKRAFEELMDN
jgi:peptidyl-prolyl cis-trans isomerase SurA